MASITTQLADFVVETINAGGPYAGELFAERNAITHKKRADIEDILVSVVALVRTSKLVARGQKFERLYQVQIVVDYAVETDTQTTRIDAEHEVVEQIVETLEKSYVFNLNDRSLIMFNIDVDADSSGLTDASHLAIALVAEYKEIHAA